MNRHAISSKENESKIFKCESTGSSENKISNDLSIGSINLASKTSSNASLHHQMQTLTSNSLSNECLRFNCETTSTVAIQNSKKEINHANAARKLSIDSIEKMQKSTAGTKNRVERFFTRNKFFSIVYKKKNSSKSLGFNHLILENEKSQETNLQSNRTDVSQNSPNKTAKTETNMITNN
jgi:hypothetical protein